MTAGHNALRGSGPDQKHAFKDAMAKWVVLIAGSTGTALRAVRHLLIRQQTAVINSIRAYLAEFGIVAPVGRRGVKPDRNAWGSANGGRWRDSSPYRP